MRGGSDGRAERRLACQLIFSPSITTMLVQKYRSTAGGRVSDTRERKAERGAHAGANFDSKRRSRAEGGLLAVYRSVGLGKSTQL